MTPNAYIPDISKMEHLDENNCRQVLDVLFMNPNSNKSHESTKIEIINVGEETTAKVKKDDNAQNLNKTYEKSNLTYKDILLCYMLDVKFEIYYKKKFGIEFWDSLEDNYGSEYIITNENIVSRWIKFHMKNGKPSMP